MSYRQIHETVFMGNPTTAEQGQALARARLAEGFELLSGLQQPPHGDVAADRAERQHSVYLIRCVLVDIATALGETLPEGWQDGRAQNQPNGGLR